MKKIVLFLILVANLALAYNSMDEVYNKAAVGVMIGAFMVVIGFVVAVIKFIFKSDLLIDLIATIVGAKKSFVKKVNERVEEREKAKMENKQNSIVASQQEISSKEIAGEDKETKKPTSNIKQGESWWEENGVMFLIFIMLAVIAIFVIILSQI
ncbi:MAG: hypothetical protein J1E31_06940 [Helicobacter sp.]|nr:hypothetical protein [Helicobacter sp.]